MQPIPGIIDSEASISGLGGVHSIVSGALGGQSSLFDSSSEINASKHKIERSSLHKKKSPGPQTVTPAQKNSTELLQEVKVTLCK